MSDGNVPSDPSLLFPLVFLFKCGLNLSHTWIAIRFYYSSLFIRLSPFGAMCLFFFSNLLLPFNWFCLKLVSQSLSFSLSNSPSICFLLTHRHTRQTAWSQLFPLPYLQHFFTSPFLEEKIDFYRNVSPLYSQ